MLATLRYSSLQEFITLLNVKDDHLKIKTNIRNVDVAGFEVIWQMLAGELQLFEQLQHCQVIKYNQ